MLLTLFALYIVLVALAAWRLRSTAEDLRRRADRSLADLTLSASLEGRDALAAQLKAMLEHLRSLRIGAFAPFSQQPLVQAGLTVAGSYSGIALLEYARLANL
jgi:hypothetical protein